jgi:hypothetical protein
MQKKDDKTNKRAANDKDNRFRRTGEFSAENPYGKRKKTDKRQFGY